VTPCSVVVGYQSFGPQRYTASQPRRQLETDTVHNATQHDRPNFSENDVLHWWYFSLSSVLNL